MIPEMLQIETLRQGYREGRFTPQDIALEVLRRIDAYDDPAVWISRAGDHEILERARELGENSAAMEGLPLYGVPFAAKDNIDVAGMPTTAACPDFAYTPGRSAMVVGKLLAAGAILIGKTNLDQFATGLNGTRSPYGAPRCVFDRRYISGGSSSGSAVAVAAGLVPFLLALIRRDRGASRRPSTISSASSRRRA